MLDTLKQWARAISRDIVALWLAARDPRVPWYAKAVAGAVAAYALSPIDLIPDFIVGFGFTDDIAVLTAAITAVRTHITPAHRLAAKQAIADKG